MSLDDGSEAETRRQLERIRSENEVDRQRRILVENHLDPPTTVKYVFRSDGSSRLVKNEER